MSITKEELLELIERRKQPITTNPGASLWSKQPPINTKTGVSLWNS